MQDLLSLAAFVMAFLMPALAVVCLQVLSVFFDCPAFIRSLSKNQLSGAAIAVAFDILMIGILSL